MRNSWSRSINPNREVRRVGRLATGGVALLGFLSMAGCGNGAPTAAASNNTPIAASPTADVTPIATTSPSSAIPASAAAGGLAARTGVLTNPSNTQMVFLYYDLAGIPPPIDQWVEQDNRVTSAPGAQKAERRTQVKAELQAGLAAVKGIGVLHLSTYANLSQYDPTYGEFTVGALSPSSQYGFQALDRQVAVKLDNGLDAQTWSVPKDKAQDITDRFVGHSLSLDVDLKIIKILPAPDGGTLVTHVVSWNLRDPSNATTVARVTVSAK